MADINKYFADEYDSTKSYAKKDKCVFEKQWYQCIKDTTGDFDPTCWKKRYLTDYLGGVAFKEATLLWENPSTELNFAPTTINLDLSKYSHVIISCVYGADISYSTIPTSTLLEVNGIVRNISTLSDNELAISSRKCTVSETSIVIGNGNRVNMQDYTCAVNQTNLCIPQKIYGVNITL